MTEIVLTVLGGFLCFYAGALSVHNLRCRRCYRRGVRDGACRALEEVERPLTEQLGPDGFRIERVGRR